MSLKSKLKKIAKKVIPRKVIDYLRPEKYPDNVKKITLHPERIAYELSKNFDLSNSKEKVLFVGLSSDYDDEKRGMSFEYFNFFLALKNMNQFNTQIFDPYECSRKYGKILCSQILYELIGIFGPKFIFYFHYLDVINHSTWKKISNFPAISTIIWLADDDWRHDETKQLEENFNLIVTTWSDGIKIRRDSDKNVLLSQWGCNHFYYKDFHIKRDVDVTFIGQLYGNRKEYVDYLLNSGINVQTYGLGSANGRLNQFEMIEVMNKSKIILNFSASSQKRTQQIKGRIFEATGCGAMVLSEYVNGIENYFVPDKEIVLFKTKEEIREKILFYLSHEDELYKISSAGEQRVLMEHTIYKRLSEIFDYASKLKFSNEREI